MLNAILFSIKLFAFCLLLSAFRILLFALSFLSLYLPPQESVFAAVISNKRGISSSGRAQAWHV
jgi:hypothetical protein